MSNVVLIMLVFALYQVLAAVRVRYVPAVGHGGQIIESRLMIYSRSFWTDRWIGS